MNIRNEDLIKRISEYKNLFLLTCPETVCGFMPGDYSRGIFCDPVVLRMIAKEYQRLIDFEQIEVIAGVDLSGVCLALALAYEYDKPMVIVREKPKRKGRTSIIGDVNFLRQETRVLLVDDAIATSNTKSKMTKILRSKGAKVVGVAVFVDCHYEEEGKSKDYFRQWFLDSGIKLYTLLSWTEMADLQLKSGTIDQDFRDLMVDSQKQYLFNDDSYGYLTKLIKYFKENNLDFPEHLKSYLRVKNIKF